MKFFNSIAARAKVLGMSVALCGSLFYLNPVTAAAGGGAVSVTVSGKKEVTKVEIDKEVVDPDDVEMLEDLIMAAVNEALRKMEDLSNQSMSKITGGLGGFGGGFPF